MSQTVKKNMAVLKELNKTLMMKCQQKRDLLMVAVKYHYLYTQVLLKFITMVYWGRVSEFWNNQNMLVFIIWVVTRIYTNLTVFIPGEIEFTLDRLYLWLKERNNLIHCSTNAL